MKKKFLLFLILGCVPLEAAVISNASDAGYVGDSLMNYIKAKYLAHKYKIPFQLNPFPYLSGFALYDLEPRVSSRRNAVKVTNEAQLNPVHGHLFYNVSYYCTMHGWADSFDILTWNSALNDKAFRDEMRRLISLSESLSRRVAERKLPEDVISVAVHIRKPLPADYQNLKSAQLYDSSQLTKRSMTKTIYSDWSFSQKFLPDQYYIDQIKRIAQMLPNEKIEVYLYNNDPNGAALCERYRKEINDERIIIIDPSAKWEAHVQADLVALSKFDYLIRGKSNFSQISDFIGKHKLTISPGKLGWYVAPQGQDCLVAETVLIKQQDEDGVIISKEIVANI